MPSYKWLFSIEFDACILTCNETKKLSAHIYIYKKPSQLHNALFWEAGYPSVIHIMHSFLN